MQRSVRDFFAKKPNANQNKSNQKNKSNVQERFDALTSRDREALRNVCHMTAVFKMAAAQMKFPPETYDELLSICDIDQKEDTQEPLSLAEANIDHIIECNKKPRILHPSLKWPKNKKQRRFAYILSCEVPKGTKTSVIATCYDQILNLKKKILDIEKEMKKSSALKAVTSYGNIEEHIARLSGQNRHKTFDDLLNNIQLVTASVYIFIKAVEEIKAEIVSFCTCDLPIATSTSHGICAKRAQLKSVSNNKTLSVIASPHLWEYVEPLLVNVEEILKRLNKIKKAVEACNAQRCCVISSLSNGKTAAERVNMMKKRKKNKKDSRSRKRQREKEKEKENNANENKMNEVIEPAKKKRKNCSRKSEHDEEAQKE
eukprot:692180_1